VAGIAGFSGVDGHGLGDADDFNACDFFSHFCNRRDNNSFTIYNSFIYIYTLCEDD
jgi:hypothetical protein